MFIRITLIFIFLLTLGPGAPAFAGVHASPICLKEHFYGYPQFEEGVKVLEGVGEEIKEALDFYYKNFLQHYRYDSMAFGLQFLDHVQSVQLKSEDGLSYPEIYAGYSPNSYCEMEKGASNCVGAAYYTCKNLPLPYRDYCYALGSKFLSPYRESYYQHAPEYHHLTAAIKYRNPENDNDRGYLLLDFGQPLPEVVLIKENKSSLLIKNEQTKWEYKIRRDRDSGEETIVWRKIHKNLPLVLEEFKTKELKNADRVITKPLTLASESYLIFTYDQNAKVKGGVIQNYVKETLTLMKGGETKTFSFSDPAEIHKALTPEFAALLNVDVNTLTKQIGRIIHNAKFLADIRSQLLKIESP